MRRGHAVRISWETGESIPADQLPPSEPPADHASRILDELVAGIGIALVVAAAEFGDVARQVLAGHLVVDAVVSSLEQGPEGLHPVRVRLLANVLADGLLDSFVGKREAVVRTRFVGVDLCAWSRVVATKPWRVALSVASTTSAATWLVSRSFMPTTAVLPTGPRPCSWRRLERGMFFRFPPK